MCAASPHRGTLIESITLGGTALACSNADDRPDAFIAEGEGLAVAFVGTIDNASDLASALRLGASPPSGPSLPELLIAAARAFGPELPARLRGVFAGAITDGTTVTCFRDHLGYRPLFHRTDEHGFFAASEAKQVVAGAGIRKEPDLDVVRRILFNATDDEMPSALRGVRRLPKSSCLRVRDGRSTQWRYWDPASLLETARYSRDELQERFDALMDQAVTRCMTGPDILSLSGGIDSPAIAAFAAPRHLERYGEPLHAATVTYPRYPTVDERRYVEPLAAAFGMPLHLYEQQANALADVGQWVTLTDGPYRSAALAQYAEDYGRAVALGLPNVLTGEHAEFVAGLQWFRFDHLVTHGRFRAARSELRERRATGRSLVDQARFIARSLAPARVMDVRRSLGRSSTGRVPAWIDERAVDWGSRPSPRERWRRLQLTAFIGPGISLEAEEVCQAVSGARSRKPWTDVDLWELFLSLRAEQKFPDRQPKGLVRRLLRGNVPDAILDRTDKTVFDEAGLAEIDYPTLRRYLVQPGHRMAGVDYRALQRRIEAQDLSVIEYGWARTLCTVQAFLAQWEPT